MKKTNTMLLIFFLITPSTWAFSQQASLTIFNKSKRELTTKIMKGSEKKGSLHQNITIAPNEKQTVNFSETGQYFTKSQAILVKEDIIENDTIYSKGAPFQIVADKKRGYSNMTMKFTVKESKKSTVEGLAPITRIEYEVN
ncbi:MAG: hypothetical protein A3K10_05710 [Bacteroidetes bacterium RIFCSPLOWO2_12_FULL_31_6]|nr:MAG: hypothetical protein A3K10_05710 [Bacteroidetes bacterium RIFCSPLOWO2_12_FULL_31_6]